MRGWRVGALLLLSTLCAASRASAQSGSRKLIKEPELTSLYPIGGARGTTVQVEIRGKNLGATYAIWSDRPGLKADISQIQEINLEELRNAQTAEIPRGNRVVAQIEIDPSVPSGCQTLRLVSSIGVSNALSFRVTAEAVTMEVEGSHDSPTKAQLIDVPLILNGRLQEIGEVDYYSFTASKDQELSFECFSLGRDRQRFEPQLTLFEQGGSWFDRARLNRIAVQDEETSKVVYQFRHQGRYFLEVRSFLGLRQNSSYQLVIESSKTPSLSAPPSCFAEISPERSSEKAFLRKLEADRSAQIASRSVAEQRSEFEVSDNLQSAKRTQTAETRLQSGNSQSRLTSCCQIPLSIAENEPNDSVTQATKITLPALIEGTIGRPGDLDTFKFAVESGMGLAFELETPDSHPPYFNPHLAVVDGDGRELFTNVFRKVGGDGDDWQKLIQAKTIYTFEAGGMYTLQIRDVTSRLGKPSFKYRILVRPQIPHVGRIEVKEDHLNLLLGEAGRLAVITEHEEGFGGQVALTVENLPSGVRALPGTEVEADRPPPLPEINKERFEPKTQQATIMLLASPEAPITLTPRLVRLSAQAIVRGKIGRPIFVRDVPLMVLQPHVETAKVDDLAKPEKR